MQGQIESRISTERGTVHAVDTEGYSVMFAVDSRMLSQPQTSTSSRTVIAVASTNLGTLLSRSGLFIHDRQCTNDSESILATY